MIHTIVYAEAYVMLSMTLLLRGCQKINKVALRCIIALDFLKCIEQVYFPRCLAHDVENCLRRKDLLVK